MHTAVQHGSSRRTRSAGQQQCYGFETDGDSTAVTLTPTSSSDMSAHSDSALTIGASTDSKNSRDRQQGVQRNSPNAGQVSGCKRRLESKPRADIDADAEPVSPTGTHETSELESISSKSECKLSDTERIKKSRREKGLRHAMSTKYNELAEMLGVRPTLRMDRLGLLTLALKTIGSLQARVRNEGSASQEPAYSPEQQRANELAFNTVNGISIAHPYSLPFWPPRPESAESIGTSTSTVTASATFPPSIQAGNQGAPSTLKPTANDLAASLAFLEALRNQGPLIAPNRDNPGFGIAPSSQSQSGLPGPHPGFQPSPFLNLSTAPFAHSSQPPVGFPPRSGVPSDLAVPSTTGYTLSVDTLTMMQPFGRAPTDPSWAPTADKPWNHKPW